MNSIKLKDILQSKRYALSNGDYSVFEINGQRIAVSGTVIASVYPSDTTVDIDKLPMREIIFQDYKKEYFDNPVIKHQIECGDLTNEYAELLMTGEILESAIKEKIPLLTSYDLDKK